MFLKEPELNLAQISNNGNLPQDQSNSWMNTEVHAYPTSRGDNYERFIDARENDIHNLNSVLTESDGIEMRPNHDDAADDNNGESLFEPYQDNNIDLGDARRMREHITDFMRYQIKYGSGLQREAHDAEDSPYRDDCGNSDDYLNSDLINSFSQGRLIHDCQTDEALFNYEETDRSCTSSDITPQDEDERMFEASDSDDSYIHDSEEHPLPRGIHNPNYPGFQHLAYTLQDYPLESPNSYENSLFLNENIVNQNIKENEKLSCLKESQINKEFNNNTQGTHVVYENNCCGVVYDINDHGEENSESEENITNLRRSEVIKIPAKNFSHGRLHLSFEDDDGEPSSVSQVSTDIFAYSDGTDCRDINLNHEVLISNEEIHNLPDEKDASSDFDDDIIALQRDIYEEIQKPLASTIENISEVVNNVIKYIVEHQDTMEDDVLAHLENTMSSVHNNYDIGKSNIPIFPSISDFSDENMLEDFPEENKMNMDDAYMSNVKEDLFSSQSSDSYVESQQSCDNEMTDSTDTKFTDLISQNKYTIDRNCNKTHPDSLQRTNDKENKIFSRCSDNEKSPPGKNNQRNTPPLKKHSFTKKDDTSASGKGRKSSAGGPSDGFDVYNIETAMPLIDLDAIENHLRAAREEERQRRNDREEIRRRLAMGAELDEFYTYGDRPGRKPSLHARLQSGMNLQICFMNETASDTESPSEAEAGDGGGHDTSDDNVSNKCNKPSDVNLDSINSSMIPEKLNTKKLNKAGLIRPSSLALNDTARPAFISNLSTQAAFFECQARLQTEARMALAQAKEMAHMQMEIERQKQEISPITEMLRCSLQKAGVQLTGDRRRVSRQMLTDMNVAQLQVIVNELHTQIEYLNESLVKLLIARDELHMGQDSMLVDIEDLTRHLSAKEMSNKGSEATDESPSTVSLGKQCHIKSHLSTLTSLLTK